MNKMSYWSRIPGFYNLDFKKRREILLNTPLSVSFNDEANVEIADKMSENVVGTFFLPLSIATNFLIDDKPCLVPMVTEESSIVAASSKMAKIIGCNQGFMTNVDPPLMRGQVQIYDFTDGDRLLSELKLREEKYINFLNELKPKLIARGGGVKKISYRIIKSEIPMLLMEPIIDVRNAMGANIVNTLMESLGKKILEDFNVKVGLQILSNLALERMANAQAKIPVKFLATDKTLDNGLQIAKKMMLAQKMAEGDIHRACTYNKGVLNGIDAVAIATGNDFRAIEAGAHAFAVKNGHYGPLINLKLENDILYAKISLPLAVGVVGGNISVHKGVQTSLQILGEFGVSSQNLSRVMASVGLAQGLAALFALCSFGIQKGHMRLHEKKLSA